VLRGQARLPYRCSSNFQKRLASQLGEVCQLSQRACYRRATARGTTGRGGGNGLQRPNGASPPSALTLPSSGRARGSADLAAGAGGTLTRTPKARSGKLDRKRCARQQPCSFRADLGKFLLSESSVFQCVRAGLGRGWGTHQQSRARASSPRRPGTRCASSVPPAAVVPSRCASPDPSGRPRAPAINDALPPPGAGPPTDEYELIWVTWSTWGHRSVGSPRFRGSVPAEALLPPARDPQTCGASGASLASKVIFMR
jgi:hypothetical protein